MAAPEVIISDAVIQEAAALASTGTNILQMATALNISRYHVRKIMDSELYKSTIKEIGDSAIAEAKQVIRANVKELSVEVNRVLKEELAENSLEAVKIYLRIVGFDQQETTTGDTTISVVLPGNDRAPIEVKSSTVTETSENE